MDPVAIIIFWIWVYWAILVLRLEWRARPVVDPRGVL
jgi:hypothetical protein